jgi:alkanesulfonate monooxygenase SsuD/methylene tetrahydromethanopterin reductase-like flavin-dependent oxidoreductase (luciferase family)
VTSGLPIIIGGNGPNRTLSLAARYADEWNAVFVSAPQFAQLSACLDELLRAAGRSPEQVCQTLRTCVVLGRTTAEAEHKLGGEPREQLQSHGVIVGMPNESVEQLGPLAEFGVQQVKNAEKRSWPNF